MTSEGPLCTSQQHGLMDDSGIGLVSSVMTCRVPSYGGVGIYSTLPQEKSLCLDYAPSLAPAPDPRLSQTDPDTDSVSRSPRQAETVRPHHWRHCLKVVSW